MRCDEWFVVLGVDSKVVPVKLVDFSRSSWFCFPTVFVPLMVSAVLRFARMHSMESGECGSQMRSRRWSMVGTL